jgi:general secretion pathway protein A
MYKNHFGLNRRIFRGNAAGADVFVGPQTAGILNGIKQALAGPDAVVTLTGPVGCGKSTAVAYSLSAVSGKNAIVRVGRFPLQRGELLDLLFDHMRIQQRPQRGNQKLALFRQLLFNLAENDSRMFILVEDAPFLGPDMLGELEVVTAADTGPSDGAAIVLMGDDYLKEMLASKALARLRQRIRLRRSLEPCSVGELSGYLRHCFRAAGGDFDKLFAGGAVELLHELSGGILRVVNNLAEASLEAAADAKASIVSLELVSRIAAEEFGLTGTFTRLPEISSKQPEPRHSDDATAELVALSMPGPERPTTPVQRDDDDDIPELIQDTQPALEILNDLPAPAKAEPPARFQTTLPDIETLSAELGTAPEIPEPVASVEPEPTATAPLVLQGNPEKPDPAAEARAEPTATKERSAATGNATVAKPQPAPEPAVEARAEPTATKKRPAATGNATVAKPEPAPKPAAEARAEPTAAEERPAATGNATVEKPESAPKPAAENRPLSATTPKEPGLASADPGDRSAPAATAVPPATPAATPELELQLEEDKAPAADGTIPTLSDATGKMASPPKDTSDEETPDWDRDPTLAELRPDLDALERAMAVAHGRDPDAADEPAPASEPMPKMAPQDDVEDIPEITLDDSINRKVDLAALERKKRLEAEGIIADDEGDEDEKTGASAEDRDREQKANAELEKIAAGLAKAKTIEDVDDKMAETLFGEELSVAAAAVAARVAEEAAAAASGNEEPAGSPAPAETTRTEMEKEFESVWGETPALEVSIDSEIDDQKGGLDISASQRLATVRALNTGAPDATSRKPSSASVAAAPKPDPIEDQITTSLTQTMKALKVSPDPAAINDDDDDDERKGGFFSRFRRS